MRVKGSATLVMIAMLIAALSGAALVQARPAAQANGRPIRLKFATFTPTRGVRIIDIASNRSRDFSLDRVAVEVHYQ